MLAYRSVIWIGDSYLWWVLADNLNTILLVQSALSVTYVFPVCYFALAETQFPLESNGTQWTFLSKKISKAKTLQMIMQLLLTVSLALKYGKGCQNSRLVYYL